VPTPQSYAEKINPLLPTASKAFGTQRKDSPSREASDLVNALILEYANEGGNITHLAAELDGLSLPGVRRRLRVARSGVVLGRAPGDPAGHGDKDPARVVAAAEAIRSARELGQIPYRDAVKAAYDRGINLKAVARELNTSYYGLWIVLRS
jgi:hypothetical protein